MRTLSNMPHEAWRKLLEDLHVYCQVLAYEGETWPSSRALVDEYFDETRWADLYEETGIHEYEPTDAELQSVADDYDATYGGVK
jgi:hypothetical protein